MAKAEPKSPGPEFLLQLQTVACFPPRRPHLCESGQEGRMQEIRRSAERGYADPACAQHDGSQG